MSTPKEPEWWCCTAPYPYHTDRCVQAKVQEAVDAERKRLRGQEVEPLKTTVEMALFRLRNEYAKNGYFTDPDTDEHIYVTTIAAVRAAQRKHQ